MGEGNNMSMMMSSVHSRAGRLGILCIISLGVLFIFGCCSCAYAEKIQTVLTIRTDPADPGENLPFTVQGTLLDAEGNAMGNKKISLEKLDSNDPDAAYTFLAVTTSDINGNYSFFRPSASSPEYLRVRYNGNAQFEGATSEIVRGHISNKPQGTTGIVSQVAKSKTKVTAKADPANPFPGQAVSIKGQLIGENGLPLAGKKVICEASDRAGTRSDFSILGISKTDEKGYFSFSASGGSTTTFIQVRFPGDDDYEESISDLILVL
jgi:protocatechuate 3,4-dioxygenase beta subunit